MSKNIEQEIHRAIEDGFQNDYDRMDNLVPVFKKEEVIESILIIMEREAIAFSEWAVKNAKKRDFDQWHFTPENNKLITTNQLFILYKEAAE